nr:receptor like protein 30 [Quercus suber]
MGADCCGWDGVTCDTMTGCVIGVDLTCSGLQGPIHPTSTFFSLRHLQRLNLAFNNFEDSTILSKFGGFANMTHLNLTDSSVAGGEASVKATATHWIPTKTTVNLVPAPILPENSSFNSKSFPNLANVSASLNTESSAFTPKPANQPITILETSPDCPLNNDITMDVQNNLTMTSPNSDLQVNSTNNVSESQSHRLLQPSDTKPVGTSQPKPPSTHSNQPSSMDTNLPQRVLGAHRKGSIEDITKPIFPTTSELSLRPCRHSSLVKPRHSLPDHHSPPRYPDRDHSPSPEDGAHAEHCRSPRMFDITPLPQNSLISLPFRGTEENTSLIQVLPRVSYFRMTARCYHPKHPTPRTFLFLLNPLAQERTTPTLSDLRLGPIHQTIPSNFSEMKILVWNCKGAGSTSFRQNFLDMTRRLRPTIAVIMETRISGTRAEEVSSSLGFNNVCRSDASGFSGGIWILWNAQDTDLDILSVTDQAIHAVI